MVQTPLAAKLAAHIATQGPISFHDYMTACLYDDEFGYYKNATAIGRAGDFVTAPEVSQIFGELIGLWVGDVWMRMGSPPNFKLIELGPGRGTLMADALRALRILPRFLSNTSIHLVETSIALREIQREALAHLPCKIEWHSELAEISPGASLIIANEFFDCLPVAQYMFDGKCWRERIVDFENGQFSMKVVQDASDLSVVLPDVAQIGDILECRPFSLNVIDDFARRTKDHPFAALIIDYGSERTGFGDTVQAVKAHRFCNVFTDPGQTDITAHVDFAQLKQKAEEAGLKTFKLLPMGEWLLRLGAETRTRTLLAKASDEEQKNIIAGVRRLIDPSQMGALFKVLTLASSDIQMLAPFD